jgi:hypothetical protein
MTSIGRAAPPASAGGRDGTLRLAPAARLWHPACIGRCMEVLIVFAVIGWAWVLELVHARGEVRVRHRGRSEQGRPK